MVNEGEEGQIYLGIDELMITTVIEMSAHIDVTYKGRKVLCAGIIVVGSKMPEWLNPEENE
jgi:hypothetical protein